MVAYLLRQLSKKNYQTQQVIFLHANCFYLSLNCHYSMSHFIKMIIQMCDLPIILLRHSKVTQMILSFINMSAQ